jgi:hypothetical protein
VINVKASADPEEYRNSGVVEYDIVHFFRGVTHSSQLIL